MAYNEALAQRVRDVFENDTRLSEKQMFGGLCFMLGGNMCCGIVGDELMLRVGPDAYEATLALPHARPMDFTGRPLKGMVYVAPAGFKTARSLKGWVKRASDFAGSLPAKKKAASRTKAVKKKAVKKKAAKKRVAKKKK